MRLAVVLLASSALQAQVFTQRGYLELRSFFFPQTAQNDSARYVGEALFRDEMGWKLRPNLRLNTTVEARFDTHRQFERRLRADFADRRAQRPTIGVRRLSLIYNRSGWTLEAGRQFIRWGKADLLNPTDRFAPKDFLNVLNTEFLGVNAARATYERGSETVDAVYVPYFTPSRSPLLNQRWVVTPAGLDGFRFDDLGARLPGRGQAGIRWNHVGSGYEMSWSFYDGYNHLPLVDARLSTARPGTIELTRYHAHMRMVGADSAVPLRWFTLKSEAAYFMSETPQADEYVQYVVQAERMMGEWVFVGGYAGEQVTARRSPLDFAPDRGITRTILGRVSYNIGPTSSMAFEGAVRQDGAGFYGKWEYSRAFAQDWRVTASGTLIRGDRQDFLGQFRRNSNFQLILRYSF